MHIESKQLTIEDCYKLYEKFNITIILDEQPIINKSFLWLWKEED